MPGDGKNFVADAVIVPLMEIRRALKTRIRADDFSDTTTNAARRRPIDLRTWIRVVRKVRKIRREEFTRNLPVRLKKKNLFYLDCTHNSCQLENEMEARVL